MSTQPLTPSRTPSRSDNIERLLSLQKSTKHISDADILSFAAEASAMKRAARAPQNNENLPPNRAPVQPVSKRLFDIDECSKQSAGSYSPELPQKAADHSEDVQSEKEEEEEEEEDSSSDDEAQALAVEQSVERILTIVNSAAKKKMERRDLKQAAIRQQHGRRVALAEEPAALNREYNANSPVDTFDNFGGDGADHAPAETYAGNATVRGLVEARILSILNTGTYEELLTLRGIGQVRALRILTARSSEAESSVGAFVFATVADLAQVGMNDWQIQRFLQSNAAAFVVA